MTRSWLLPAAFAALLLAPVGAWSAPLPDLGLAPELRGLAGWIPSTPTTLAQLRGKVVLVKFWAFDCINCRRTLPATQAWYDRYHAKGFEIVAVHTPELDEERVPANVAAAVRRAHITYPVALDPDYATWRAYGNRYWPAEYLIDARGHLRLVHFGEGSYDVIDRAIATLLDEASAAKAKRPVTRS